jgi:hypothetical protein
LLTRLEEMAHPREKGGVSAPELKNSGGSFYC